MREPKARQGKGESESGMSDRIETVRRRFACPRLGGAALLTYDQHYCEKHPNPADYHLHGAILQDCAHKVDCGLWYRDALGLVQMTPGTQPGDCPAQSFLDSLQPPA
jgi:hypothetical protein